MIKYLENHFFIVIAHILTLVGITWFTRSLFIIISVVIAIAFLLLAKFIRKNNILNYIVQLIVFSTIPFCYSTDEFIENMNVNWYSLIPLITTIVVFVFAYKMPNSRQESYLNVKVRYTEDKAIRKKTNKFASRCLYFIILPLFLSIFFFDGLSKLIINVGIILIVFTAIFVYANIIGHRKEKLERNQEEL